MKFILYVHIVSLMPGGAWLHNLARFGDIAIFLAKNEYSTDFKSGDCRTNKKRDTAECSGTIGEIVNFPSQAPL